MKKTILATTLSALALSGGIATAHAEDRSYSVTIYQHSDFNKDWETQGYQYNRAIKDYTGDTVMQIEIQNGDVNQPPMAIDDRVTAQTGVATIFDASIFGNDYDPEGDAVSLHSIEPTSNGNLTDNGDGTLTYTSNAGFEGVDEFYYTLVDSYGDESVTARVTIVVEDATAPETPPEPMTPDQQTWVNFFNTHCAETYNSWTDVESDGFINCATGIDDTQMPEVEMPEINNPNATVDFSRSCVSERKWKFFHRWHNRDGRGLGHRLGWYKFKWGKKGCRYKHGKHFGWLKTKLKHLSTQAEDDFDFTTYAHKHKVEGLDLREGGGRIKSGGCRGMSSLKKFDASKNRKIKDFSFLKDVELDDVKVKETDFKESDLKYVRVKNNDSKRVKCSVKDKHAFKHHVCKRHDRDRYDDDDRCERDDDDDDDDDDD